VFFLNNGLCNHSYNIVVADLLENDVIS